MCIETGRSKLAYANLREADLTEANLGGTNLSGATFCLPTMPDGSENDRC